MTNNPNLALRTQWQDDIEDDLTTLPFHEYEKVTELRGVYRHLFRSVPFKDAAGNETPMYVDRDGYLQDEPLEFKPSIAEIAATAAIVVSLFSIAMILQIAGW